MRPNPHRKVHTDQGEPRMPRIGRLPPETSETARDPSRPDTHHGMTQGRTLTIPGVLSSDWVSVRRRHGCRTTPGRALALMCGLVTPRGSEGVEDPDAEEVEVRSAEHLAFQHLDLVDGSFHGAGAVRQGSSPRMRGAARPVRRRGLCRGVIPTSAGSRSPSSSRSTARPCGHPRGCGEQAGKWGTSYAERGSSPRARGAGAVVVVAEVAHGVVPAGAGSRRLLVDAGGPLGGHPRGSGGAERAPQHFQVDVGVIPTGAWPATTMPVRPAPRPCSAGQSSASWSLY